jgi:hypothetical protein
VARKNAELAETAELEFLKKGILRVPRVLRCSSLAIVERLTLRVD